MSFHNASYSYGTKLTFIAGRFRGVSVDNGLDVHLDTIETNATVASPGGSDICLGCTLVPNTYGPSDTFITNSNLSGATGGSGGVMGAGLEMQAANGVFIDKVNTDQNQIGLWAHPRSASINQTTTPLQVSAVYAADIYVDSLTRWGALFDTTGGGRITNNRFTNFWTATCGTSSSPDPCVFFQGSGSIQNNSFKNVHVFNGQGHGFQLNAGTDFDIEGSISGNNQASGPAVIFTSAERFRTLSTRDAVAVRLAPRLRPICSVIVFRPLRAPTT